MVAKNTGVLGLKNILIIFIKYKYLKAKKNKNCI